MAETRELMLARIREAIAVQHGPELPLPRDYERQGALSAEARVETLLERLREYDAQIYEASSENVAATVTNLCRQRQVKSLVVPEGFPAEWLPAFGGMIAEGELDRKPLSEIEAVLATCTVAIAHTGSLVLRHGPGEGTRRLTLLPDLHICIVREEQVVETVPEAFDALREYVTAPITFISGPSATADIEMTRIRGVHGPRYLDVVLVRG